MKGFINMKMERTIIVGEGTFHGLLSKAQNGDVIVLYDGVWNDYRPCIDGVLVEKNGQYFLNDDPNPFNMEEKQEDIAWRNRFFTSHSQGTIYERGSQLVFVVIL